MSVEIKQRYIINVDGYEVMFDRSLGDSFTACMVSLDNGQNWHPARPVFMAMRALGEQFPDMVAGFEKDCGEGVSPLDIDDGGDGELEMSDL